MVTKQKTIKLVKFSEISVGRFFADEGKTWLKISGVSAQTTTESGFEAKTFKSGDRVQAI